MIDVEKESLCINKIIGNKKFEITAEGDFIIPDTKPDILRDITLTGKTCIYKREILDEKIRLDGDVNIYLIYLAASDNQKVRGLNTTIDFSEILDFSGIDSKMTFDEQIKIKQIECKILNERKVNLKAILEIDITVFSNETEEIIKQINNVNDIQSQIVSLDINSLVGQNSCKASAKENIKIENNDMLLEILSIDFDVINKDTKISYNKILAKADVKVKALYMTEEGKIKKVEEIIPIMGFIDCTGVSEENICDVKYKLKNMIIKENRPEEHSISIEIEFEIFARVYETKQVSLIQDMYSPSMNLTFEENSVNTIVNMKNTVSTVKIREKLKLEDIEYNKICDVQFLENVNEINVSRDKLRYNGDLKIKLILTNENEDNIEIQNRVIPFDFTQEIDGIDKDSNIQIEVIPMAQSFDTENLEIDVNLELSINTNSYNLKQVNVIDEIEETEEEESNPYSMVIYFVKPNDTLWKIAKKYKSTVDDIVRVNGIENPNKINIGEQLFIPKCTVCYG